MIFLLINVEVIGKGVKKVEFFINVGDIFMYGKGFDEIISKVFFLVFFFSYVNVFYINVREFGGFL